MKHYIGPSQYSTYNRTSYASEMPIGNPVGSMISAINMGNRYNEQAQKEDAAKRSQELAEAKQMAYQAEQEWDKMEQSQYMVSDPGPQNIGYQQAMDITGNAAGVNRFAGHRTYPGFAPEPVQPSFFDTYVANRDQLNSMYPAPQTRGFAPYSNPNVNPRFQTGFGPFDNNGGF